MKYLLDTNVISELQKENCNPSVKNFMDQFSFDDLYLSVISTGEICRGIEKLPAGKKKQRLSVWLHSVLPEYFQGHILPIDQECMLVWGKLTAEIKKTLPVLDSLLAAAALTHNMPLITRNTKDFAGLPALKLLNPWEY